MAEVSGLAGALEDKADAAATLVLLGGKADKADKGAPNGYAGLGSDGKVPAEQLPAVAGGGPAVGDLLQTALAPGAKYLEANGSSYLRIAWPQLSPLLPDGGNLALTAMSTRAIPAGRDFRGAAYGNGVFVAVSSSGSVCATSTDSLTWTERSMPPGVWLAVAFGRGLFVAVDGAGTNKIATSPDGITWTARTLPASANWVSIVFGADAFVLISGSTPAASSLDGITWTTRTLPSGAWSRVAFGNGVFVAVSSSGTNSGATSPDGITWTPRTLPTTGWNSVAFGSGTFVAVAGGSVASSPDGITWTTRSGAGSSNFVFFGNGTFLAVQNTSASAFTSRDGTTWTTLTMPAAFNWSAGAYGAGRLVVVARGGTDGASSNLLTDPTLFLMPNVKTDPLLKSYLKGEA